MTLDEFLNIETFASDNFDKYVADCGGINKLHKKNLDLIIKKHYWMIHDDSFMDLYKIVSENESGKLIKAWTWIAGFASVISVIIAVLSLLSQN